MVEESYDWLMRHVVAFDFENSRLGFAVEEANHAHPQHVSKFGSVSRIYGMYGMCRMCTMWDGMALLLIRFWDMGYGSSCFIMFHHVSRLKKSRPNQYL